MKKFRLSGSCVGNPTAPASLKHLSSMHLTSSAERPLQVSLQAGQQPMNRLRITYESLKNHLRFAAAFLLLLCLGVGNAWGATTSTLTFTTACNGSGTADDKASWKVTSDASESTYDATKGIHYGTSNVAVSYIQLETTSISGTISQVVVNTSGASNTSGMVSVTVGSTSFKSDGSTAVSISSSAASYTFTGSGSGTIIVYISQSSAKKALYCKSIGVSYTSTPATIKLSEAGEERVISGTHYASDSYTLPTSTDATCSDKVLVGWSKVAVAETNTKPTSNYYDKGASVTLAVTNNFYAVYATASGGGDDVTESMNSFDATSGNVDNGNNVSYEAAQGDASTAPAIYSNEIRIYQNGGLLTIAAHNDVKLTSITIGSSMATKVQYAIDGGSYNGSDQSISANGTFTLNDELEADEVVFKCTGTDKNSRLYLNSLSVTYSEAPTYSAYTTSCCQPLGGINGSIEWGRKRRGNRAFV